MSRLAFVSDHAGFELKEYLKSYLKDKGYEMVDYGTHSAVSCDYADYAHPAAEAVETGRCDMGIGMCGSGEGMQMTLNKHQGIRAALCWIPEVAELSRRHNDANFLVLPARFISHEEAKKILDLFLSSPFDGGRHLERIKKIPLHISVEGEVL